ncbi:Bypass of stop codon 6 [Lecanosticta acicola]|uniref:Bypass of stop codon 6 n=1 Tax=Lecanosticta acicola TaxID=111012 RepID=A0AAI8YUX9_9PEZI|nr:Bypass of stop codon 6 [Lecanosticta acicola]
MSSTSTTTVQRATRDRQDGINVQAQKGVKSPPASLQSIRHPTQENHFPDEDGRAESPGRTLEQMLYEEPSSGNEDSHRVFEVKESWNHPRINIYRLAAVFFALFNLGVHDAAYGPLIPSLETYYGLNYTTVSLVFLATFPGYVLAALSSDRLHLRFGRRGLAVFASACRLAAYIALVCHPPWAVIIVMLVFCGWGNGLLDAGWNAWVGDLNSPNELLGLIHALYGLGAAVAPLVASAMVDKYGLNWYDFYFIPLGLASLELLSGMAAFWKDAGADFRSKNTDAGNAGGRTRASLKSRVTWTVAIFLLVYVGSEVSLSGWIVTFMQRVRGAQPFDSSLTSTGFWLGVTLGRVVLGFVTGRIGERWAIVGYLLLAMGLELIFWLVPQFVVSAVAVALLGFFIGPMFPAAVVALSKLLPKHLHVGAISFAAAVGMGGAAVLPFAVGAIASAAGVKVLQPIILALLAMQLLMWLSLPKLPKDKHND